jgi:hypothetical protein
MKYKLTFTIALSAAIWWMTGVLFVCQSANWPSRPFSQPNYSALWTNQLNVLSNPDFYNDLDPRDERNNPVGNVNAVSKLRDIFLSGLVSQLVDKELLTISLSLAVLRQTVSLGTSLVRFFPILVEKIIAVATGFRTTIKNLVCISRGWSSPGLIFDFLALSCLLIVAPIKKSPLVLRC